MVVGGNQKNNRRMETQKDGLENVTLLQEGRKKGRI